MIADHEYLTRVNGYRLYAVFHVEGTESDLSYPFVFENDILVLDVTGTQAGIEMKTFCPTKNVFSWYRNGYRDYDIPLQLRSLLRRRRRYRGTSAAGAGFADRNAA